MSEPLRAAVVGVGTFGRHHAAKLAAAEGARLVAVADLDEGRAAEAGKAHGVPWFLDHRELLDKVDAVTIAVPAVHHFEVASPFIERGIHVLVEKPIAHDLESARKMVALAEAKGGVLHVGHLPRFSAVTEALRRRVVRPLYIECIRIAPFQERGIDVNVVLDLMIHDLDLVLSLVEQPLAAVDAAGAPVFSPLEDIATVRLRFADGCIANITASRISLKTERVMRIFQPNAYIAVDFDKQAIRCVRKRSESGPLSLANVEQTNDRYETVDALEREVACFLAAATGARPPIAPVTGQEAVRALEAAIAVSDSLRRHAEVVASAASRTA